jgi:hypothetical protein
MVKLHLLLFFFFILSVGSGGVSVIIVGEIIGYES